MLYPTFIPTTYIGLIYLSKIPKFHLHFILHVVADSPQHEPRGLLRYADVLCKLYTAYAFLVRQEHIDCVKPLVQWDMAVLKHGSDSYREPLAAVTTFV